MCGIYKKKTKLFLYAMQYAATSAKCCFGLFSSEMDSAEFLVFVQLNTVLIRSDLSGLEIGEI